MLHIEPVDVITTGNAGGTLRKDYDDSLRNRPVSHRSAGTRRRCLTISAEKAARRSAGGTAGLSGGAPDRIAARS